MGWKDEAAKRSAEIAIEKLYKSLDWLRKEWKAASPTVKKTLESNAAKIKKEITIREKQFEDNMKEFGLMKKDRIRIDSDSSVGKLSGKGIRGPKMSDKVSSAQARYDKAIKQYNKFKSILNNKRLTQVQRDAYQKQLDKVIEQGKAAKKELSDLKKMSGGK